MKTLPMLLLLLLATPTFSQSTSATIDNIDDITTQGNPGWSECIKPTCDPGGSGTPTSFTQTFASHAHEKDTNGSMAIAMVAPATSGTINGLWTYKVGAFDSTTRLQMDLWFYPDANMIKYASQLEFDQAVFDSTLVTGDTPYGTEFMFGSQCDLQKQQWEIFNEAAKTWVAVTPKISCTTKTIATGWHHLQETVHRVVGDPGNCSYGGNNYPCEYYDSITIDGVTTIPTNTNLPAGPLPKGWSSTVLIQVQMNAGPAGTSDNAMTTYYDLMDFSFIH
jgi:hypothetical protein